MDERLTERRRVRDEGLRVVNRCQWGGNLWGSSPLVDLTAEEVRAKYVPAAAVILPDKRYSDLLGLKSA